MIKALFLILVLTVLIPRLVFSETIRKVDFDEQNTIVIYYTNNKEVAKEIFDDSSKLVKKEGVIPDGVVMQYSNNGKILGEWNYKNDKKEGVVKRYYDNGKIRLEANYKDGIRHGKFKGYYLNGKFASEDDYTFGRLNGTSKIYLENGSLFSEINYIYGIREGTTKTYLSNGSIGEISYFKNGKRDGTAKTYFSKDPSKVEYEFTYVNGELTNFKSNTIDGKLR